MLAMLMMVCFFVVMVLGNFLVLGGGVVAEYNLQKNFRAQYGDDWKAQYDKHLGEGALDRAHVKMVAGLFGMPVILTLVGLLIWQIKGPNRDGDSGRGRRRSSRQKNKW
ncbi:MAG TPA: hypothetical protein VG733_06995 [Chthoniobacteraceae bacterium]|nr:hypothetical protein [Chthoniobacteraceae bacterium]